jgi:hypothetical protein
MGRSVGTGGKKAHPIGIVTAEVAHRRGSPGPRDTARDDAAGERDDSAR